MASGLEVKTATDSGDGDPKEPKVDGSAPIRKGELADGRKFPGSDVLQKAMKKREFSPEVFKKLQQEDSDLTDADRMP